jgi:uncharacterized YigZ family protein
VEQFESELRKIKSKYADATHHCYAWRMNPNSVTEFSQDDGEPAGTAGLPILNKLKSFDLINGGCVVVRYFGGTKLGKSGLIHAYGYTAELCLSKASLLTIVPTKNFRITYPYNQQSQIDKLKYRFDLKELDAQYLENVTLDMACRTEEANKFTTHLEKLEHKGIEIEKIGSGFLTMRT